jgi:hypothetical protein
MVISYLLRQLQRQGDVFGLTALVAAAEQDDQDTPALHVIDPVSGAMIDTKLADAVAHRLCVARDCPAPGGAPVALLLFIEPRLVASLGAFIRCFLLLFSKKKALL